MQLYNLPADALPFFTVEASDIDVGMSPRSPKRRRMSTDSADEPPASAVSFGSFSGGDGYSSAASSTSAHSKRASMEFPFSTYNSNGTLNQGPALRGSGNTFWHPPMMPQGAADSDVPLFQGPVMLPASAPRTGASTPSSSSASSSAGSASSSGSGSGSGASEDSPMDYLHPPAMAIQDEESLFSTYLHPPMAAAEDAAKGNAGQEDGAGNGGAVGPNMHASMFVESYFQ